MTWKDNIFMDMKFCKKVSNFKMADIKIVSEYDQEISQ